MFFINFYNLSSYFILIDYFLNLFIFSIFQDFKYINLFIYSFILKFNIFLNITKYFVFINLTIVNLQESNFNFHLIF